MYNSWQIDEFKTCTTPAMATAIDRLIDLMGQAQVTVPRGHPKHLQKLRDHVMVLLCNLLNVPDG